MRIDAQVVADGRQRHRHDRPVHLEQGGRADAGSQPKTGFPGNHNGAFSPSGAHPCA
jgi:hypothetical protein